MAARLNHLLNHIAVREHDTAELASLKQRLALASLQNQFTVSPLHLQQMMFYMLHEMTEGLEGRPSTIRMLPSYVYKADPRCATGVFYALDLGGTNFRVLRVCCDHGSVVSREDAAFRIPHIGLTGSATDLFGFIAKSVRKFMETSASEDLNKTIPLGFTFSFPVDQLSVNSGKLIKWTKGFSTRGVEGHDVVALLQAELKKEQVNVNVVALCNDTVGTLITRYFDDVDAQVGVILGTGANACYFDKASAVTKDPAVSSKGDVETAINMECGNFDSKYRFVLPITCYDDDIDAASQNRDNQRQEKLVAGMYLGEIARRVLVHLSLINCLPSDIANGLKEQWKFETKHMGLISSDRLPGLHFTRHLLRREFDLNVKETSDLRVIRDVCVLVRNRAAQVASMFISGPLMRMHKTGRATVALDGSVYEKTPSFRRVMKASIMTLLGKDADVDVALQKDGSGIGAALISALTVLSK